MHVEMGVEGIFGAVCLSHVGCKVEGSIKVEKKLVNKKSE